MNAIHETLDELRRAHGIKGAAVVTLDGLVAAESLGEQFSGEVVAGLASYLLMTLNRSLKEGGLGDCSQFVLHATNGKVILTALEEAYLVVIFDQFADAQAIKNEAMDAARRIRQSSRIA